MWTRIIALGNVWYCCPSKRPASETTLGLWRQRGYEVAIQQDPSDSANGFADPIYYRPYRGYAEAVNFLVFNILEMDQDCDWVVIGGDDIEPDANVSPNKIAQQCKEQFGPTRWNGTFGVMQPTGDRWGDHRGSHKYVANYRQRCAICGQEEGSFKHKEGAYIDRVAGSPWLGREFCKRVNQGNGPLHPGYFHMGCDEELQAVATKLGVFWQRPDLIHLHRHWGREANTKSMPDFLKRANSPEEWKAYKELFESRKAAGFPGHEPL